MSVWAQAPAPWSPRAETIERWRKPPPRETTFDASGTCDWLRRAGLDDRPRLAYVARVLRQAVPVGLGWILRGTPHDPAPQSGRNTAVYDRTSQFPIASSQNDR